MTEYMGPRRGVWTQHPQLTPELEQRIATQLIRLHRNTLRAVPIRYYLPEKSGKLGKMFAPLREARDCCPTKSVPNGNGKGGRVSRWKACVERQANAAYATYMAQGAGEDEAAKARAMAKKEATRVHTMIDHDYYWTYHVRGRDAKGDEFYRGAYSHFHMEKGLDVIWDLDASFPGRTPIQLAQDIVAKLQSLDLGPYVYANATHGGTGVHVRLCLDIENMAPSWLREQFGKAVLVSLGYKPGGDPAKGQIEAFPKQKGGGDYGNLVGLPCSSHLMLEGRTNLLDYSWQKITDMEETARFLEAQKQATLDEFKAAARKLNLNPDVEPVTVTRDPTKPIKFRMSSGEQLEIVTATHDLDRLIRTQLPLSHYLERWVGREATNGKYCCPMHEPAGGALSFSTTVADMMAAKIGYVHERYKCFGDCQGSQRDTGDVIDLHRHLRNMTREQARDDLAHRLGIDPEAYRAKFRETQQQLRAGLNPRPLISLRDWMLEYIRHLPDAKKAATAVAHVLLKTKLAPELIAHSITVGIDGVKTGEAFAMVGELQEKLEAGEKKIPGAGWLRARVSHLALVKLARLSALVSERTELETTGTITPVVIGSPRYGRGSPERVWLRQTYLEIPAPPKKGEEPSGAPVHPLSRIRNMLRFPCGCGDFVNRITADGKVLGEAPITCGVMAVCSGCALKHAQGVHTLLTRQPTGEDDPLGNLSWRGRTSFHSMWITSPLHLASSLLTFAGSASGGKLRFVGMTPEGLVRVLWIAEDEEVLWNVSNEAYVWAAEHRLPFEAPKTDKTSDYRVAASWVYDSLISPAVLCNEYIRTGRKQELLNLLLWIKGKSLARRSGKTPLPYPRRQDVRAVHKTDVSSLLEYDGQETSTALVHKETGYVLAEAKHPFTISAAMGTANRHAGFLMRMASVEGRETGIFSAAA